MHMAKVADAIVQCGRSTLEWTVGVIRGRTRSETFAICADIANLLTTLSPPSVLLKMKKVYSPCILLSKKR